MTQQQPPAMAPEQMPQQRLYAVADSPEAALTSLVTSGIMGEEGIPKRMPRGASFICQAEWAWSPWNNRIDNYHISLDSTRRRWVFWSSWLDDNGLPWQWVTRDRVMTQIFKDVWPAQARRMSQDLIGACSSKKYVQMLRVCAHVYATTLSEA